MMLQLPASLRLEPARFGMGALVEMTAGATLPDTTIAVMSGHGKKMKASQMAGKKQSFTVVQRLWRMESKSGKALPTCPLKHPKLSFNSQ